MEVFLMSLAVFIALAIAGLLFALDQIAKFVPPVAWGIKIHRIAGSLWSVVSLFG